MGPWCRYGELNNGKVYSSLCFLFSFPPHSAVASSLDFTGHHSGLLLNPTVWAQLVWVCPEPCRGHMVPNCLGTARCLLLHGDGWGQAHCWLRSAPLTWPGRLLSLLFADLQKSPWCCPQDPVPLTLVGTFLYLPLYIPLLKESYHHSSFLLCRGLIFFGEKGMCENTACMEGDNSPGDNTSTTVVDLSQQPDVGFTPWSGWGWDFQEDKCSPNLKYDCGCYGKIHIFFKSMSISLLISVLWSFRTGRLI